MIFESEYLYNAILDNEAMYKWRLQTYNEFDSENMRRQDAYFELANYADYDITLNLHPEAEC